MARIRFEALFTISQAMPICDYKLQGKAVSYGYNVLNS